MSIRVLLVRHGETAWNRAGRFQGHTDVELSEIGRAQAREVAARLREVSVRRVASSDLRRARETAEILAAELPAELACVDADLRERSYGCFEGLTREECAERFPDLWAAHARGQFVDVPGAEPRAEVTARIVRGVTRVVETHGRLSGGIAIVTHGGVMRAFLEVACAEHVPPVPNLAVYELEYVAGAFARPRLF
ncbi:MAG: histidine phosphatase family protein [Deltaproteobacteria bacterium]|nr:histidine phosphatase family protein [Deltaproteobacteria bacterium]